LRIQGRMETFRIVKAATGEVVLEDGRAARKLLEKLLGLMGKRRLPEGQGLLLPRCSSIHMFFMRFPIDAVYLDKEKRVKKIVRALKPWRISWCPWADSVLEVPAGWADRVGLRAGDKLLFLSE